jgi:antitoxin ParD1/3/4
MIALPPEVEILVQRQVQSGKYGSIEEALLAGMHLLEQRQQEEEEDIYQGRLPELQKAAQIGWEESQRGAVVDGPTAMNQLLEDLRSRYGDGQQWILQKLNAKFAKIVTFPKMGKPRDEILPGSRMLSVDRYLILYVVIGDDVEIVRVVSGYRDLSKLFTAEE